MDTRIIVAALVRNKSGELLFCKMPENRGVFPGQWGFPGGGIEKGETMTDGLRRELREEIGIEVENINPLFFKDGRHTKTNTDGTETDLYMIFLLFECIAESDELDLNDEFDEYRWETPEGFRLLDLNCETIDTLRRLGEAI